MRYRIDWRRRAALVPLVAAILTATSAQAEWRPRRAASETATGALAAPSPAAPSHAPNFDAEQPSVMQATLRAETAADTSRVEITESSGQAGTGYPARYVVTDVAVRLTATGGTPLAVALGLPNAPPNSRQPPSLGVELLLVAAGRLVIESRIYCGAWVDDIAVCRTPCGDGAFGIVRAAGPGAPALRLTVGQAPAGDGSGIIEGIRLGSRCSDASDVRLVPRRGLKLADIVLAPG